MCSPQETEVEVAFAIGLIPRKRLKFVFIQPQW
jgi:hypothetical protein